MGFVHYHTTIEIMFVSVADVVPQWSLGYTYTSALLYNADGNANSVTDIALVACHDIIVEITLESGHFPHKEQFLRFYTFTLALDDQTPSAATWKSGNGGLEHWMFVLTAKSVLTFFTKQLELLW